jgi:hypothetical protein
MPPAGTAAWWPLDSIDSSSTEDVAGFHAARVIGTMSVGPGRTANAMTFPGAGARLEAVDSDDLDVGSSDFSIQFWVRTSDTSSLLTLIDKRTLNPVRGYSVFLSKGWSACNSRMPAARPRIVRPIELAPRARTLARER